MDLRADERGQPVQIGFVLVLAFVVLSFGLYQAILVPQQNAEIEYSHFQGAESDVAGLQSGVTNAVASGRTRAVTVDLGPGYPARLVGINPGPPAGTLRTNASGEVTFSGLGRSASDVCASDPGVSSVTTRTLEFRPGYNAYEEPRRIAYEHGLVARLFASGSLYGDQSFLLTGGSGPAALDLRLLTGAVSASGTGAPVVDLHPSREFTTTVSPSSGFTVVLPSSLSAGEWREALPPGSTANLTAIRANGDRVEFEFTAGTYELSCAVVGLNTRPAYQPPVAASGGTDAPPTASIDGLSDATSPGANSDAEFSVTWNVTDDRELDGVSIQLMDSGGTLVAETSPTVSGRSASGTVLLTDAGGSGQQYVVKVVVSDSTGHTDTESVTARAGR